MMKRIPRGDLNRLLAALAERQKLYIPADDGAGQAAFTPWAEGVELTGRLNTARSATSVLPKPTSPQRSLSIGTGFCISVLIS